ncbi:OTU-domain-containing protein [Irpex rosettiformis]|uniref:OTU-domain-containing protein n=1 Tax=Irpex rosettiformis TaxID=378272 RepID=A0ACB8TW03_9APHY|nr:OTU-domain-containing protein [Irpex rosettiformis]
MAPMRLRHPKGVTTIQIDLDQAKVSDLQQEIFAITEIPPSLQELKAGYPPHGLTLIPELPIESLGLKQGEQLIVTQNAEAAHAHRPAASPQAGVGDSPAVPMTGLTASQVRDSVSPSPGPSGPDYVLTEGGYLVHRIVPDDNSCLFSSVALVFEQSINKASEIRKIVADEIRKDPETWSDAILGRSRDEYISHILKPSSWGGAIELTILAKHYSTEIASVDVETGRIDKFTPTSESDGGNRCILIYSGIHYDAATIAPILDAPEDFHQTVMPRMREGDDDPTLVAAKKLADKLRAKRAYTNTSTFDLRCQICQKGLKGEKEARAHASETGHIQFGEY